VNTSVNLNDETSDFIGEIYVLQSFTDNEEWVVHFWPKTWSDSQYPSTYDLTEITREEAELLLASGNVVRCDGLCIWPGREAI